MYLKLNLLVWTAAFSSKLFFLIKNRNTEVELYSVGFYTLYEILVFQDILCDYFVIKLNRVLRAWFMAFRKSL